MEDINAGLSVSDRGIAFIARHEGFKPSVYKDPAGLDTIGYGHKVKAGEKFGPKLGNEEARRLLLADIATAEAAVHKQVKVTLAQQQYDALVSFVFNVGGQAFASSTLLKQLNAGNYKSAATEMLRWCNIRLQGKVKPSPGLLARRVAEQTMFHESMKNYSK